MSERKRGRNDKDDFRRYGPAAAALRRGHVFRDAREAKEQVTVDSILRDAVEMNRFHSSGTSRRMTVSTTDSEVLLLNSREELALYRQRKRAEMETKVLRGGKAIGNWVKYARWEAQQESFERMRNVMERALEIHGLDFHIWRDYAELEASHGFVEEARQVFQRGVKLLPAAVDLWLKYALLEQGAGQSERAREVFLQWTHTKDAPPCAYELFVLHEIQRNSRSIRVNSVSSVSTALVVSQTPYAEECRPILRRYVEAVNSTDSWLFYYTVEQIVLRDTKRAIKVLETALDVLPQDVLYGPVECRIPLTLAEAYSTSNNLDAARELYRLLLSRVTDPEGAETVLRNYRSFERLHVQSVEDVEYICFLEAKNRYEERLSKKREQQGEWDECDYDTALSLYVLLCGEIKRLDEILMLRARNVVHDNKKENDLRNQREGLELQALDVLRRAVEEFPSPRRLSISQQHAILVSAFTKRAIRCSTEKGAGPLSAECDRKNIADVAREIIAKTIKQFPFDRASCPQLWSDAAALEEHVFTLHTQARRLLSAGFQVTKDMSLMDALIQLEERVYTQETTAIVSKIEEARHTGIEMPELPQKLIEVRNDYVRRMRAAFQLSIKAAPLDAARWHQYARWEEQGGGLRGGNTLSQTAKSRAAMLYKSCIASLSEEARKSTSLDRRFEVLKQVDETWSRWMAMELRSVRRSLRAIQRIREKGDEVPTERLQELCGNSESLQQMCVSLLNEVAAAYRHEALSWSFTFRRNSGNGVLSSLPPSSLPKTLKPAILRLAEACDVVVRCLWQDVAPAKWQVNSTENNPNGSATDSVTPSNNSAVQLSQEEEGKKLIRDVFRSLIEKERRELLQMLVAGTTQSFEENKLARLWRESLLGPLLVEWGRYETAVGGSVAAVSAAAAAGSQSAQGEGSITRRRTRLFKKSL